MTITADLSPHAAIAGRVDDESVPARAAVAIDVAAGSRPELSLDTLPGRRPEFTYASRSPEAFYGLQPEPGVSIEEAFRAALAAQRGTKPAGSAR